jgi:hypothetical protein
MRKSIPAIAAILMAGLFTQYATAEAIPNWIKNNALWWSEGAISESDFVLGLQHLISIGVLKVPQTSVSAEQSDKVPEWVKNNAAWWADGTIDDASFLNGIQHLIKIGVISVSTTDKMPETSSTQMGSQENGLQAELDACQKITKAYDRLRCEDAVDLKIKIVEYKANSETYQVGPITFYYPGSELEISQSGQANLYIKILAVNTGSNDNVVLMCTGPAICNYDVSNGDKTFKYSSTDFTSGQIALKPGDAREINLFFGPNIGYGGTTFEYDSAKDYYLRISEPWGSQNIPLNLK